MHRSHVDSHLSGSLSEAPSLPALLYRIAGDYDNMLAVCGTEAAAPILKMLPGLRPWPSNKDIMRFASGELPHLAVPFNRHVLRSLPDLHEESSCFAYDTASVLGDGTTKVEY